MTSLIYHKLAGSSTAKKKFHNIKKIYTADFLSISPRGAASRGAARYAFCLSLDIQKKYLRFSLFQDIIACNAADSQKDGCNFRLYPIYCIRKTVKEAALMDQRLIQILLDSFWKILLPGLTATIPLTVIAFSCAMVIAVATAMVQFANLRGLKQLARFYIWVFRGTPLLVQLFVVFYGLPKAGIVMDPFPAAVLVFSLNEGAYCAETIRAALESVPAGQLEAGYCVGMSWMQTMRRIILPQAMRTAFPPLSNSVIAMVKDTSLAANITVMEMFKATEQINATVYEPLALYIEVGLSYLLFSTVLTKLQQVGEKKLSVYSGQEV